MTKPTKWVCAQWRLRSAWASAQSDQSSLSAWRKLGSLATHWAYSLIRVFAGRTATLLVLSWDGSCYDKCLLVTTSVESFKSLPLFLYVLYFCVPFPLNILFGFVTEPFSRTEMIILYAALGCVVLLIVSFSILCIVRYRKRK